MILGIATLSIIALSIPSLWASSTGDCESHHLPLKLHAAPSIPTPSPSKMRHEEMKRGKQTGKGKVG